MRRRRLQFAVLVAVMGLLGVAAAAVAGGGGRDVREHLTGYQETPLTISTTGAGDFRAKVKHSQIEYRLSYSDLEGDVSQSHIHLGAEATTGGISVFLCSNLGNGPAGTQACPGPHSGTITGTIVPADVIGPPARASSRASTPSSCARSAPARRTPTSIRRSTRVARSAPSSTSATGTTSGPRGSGSYGIWTPEIAREMTSRWISEVPSKIV